MKLKRYNKSILIADNDAQVRRMLFRSLVNRFDQTLVAANPEEALDLLDVTHLLTDYDFGTEMTGFDLIVEAKMRHPHIESAMVFTGSALPAERPPEVDAVFFKEDGLKHLLKKLSD